VGAPRKSATKPRGRPFEPGNPGKPKGTRHRATLAVEALLEGEAEALTRKAIERALEGDATALRLCLDRLAPPRRDRPVSFAVAAVEGPDDALKAMGEVLSAMGNGELSPSEAGGVLAVVDGYLKAWQATELERRVAELEARSAK
jgi:hypothetical protein